MKNLYTQRIFDIAFNGRDFVAKNINKTSTDSSKSNNTVYFSLRKF